MLRRGRGAAKPAVIRNVDEHVCAVQNEPADFTGKHSLVTDERAETSAGQITDGVASSLTKVARKPCEIFSEPEKITPRYVFAERDQVNLVVLEFLAALRIEHGRAIVSRKPAVGARFQAHHAKQEHAQQNSQRYRGD